MPRAPKTEFWKMTETGDHVEVRPYAEMPGVFEVYVNDVLKGHVKRYIEEGQTTVRWTMSVVPETRWPWNDMGSKRRAVWEVVKGGTFDQAMEKFRSMSFVATPAPHAPRATHD